MNSVARSVSVVLRTGLLFLPALLPTVGCSRADYEVLVDQEIGRLKTANKFKTLESTPVMLAAWKLDQAPTGTKVTFRKPTYFLRSNGWNELTPDPRLPGTTIRPERLKPPFLQNFPGYAQTWESMESSQGGYNIAYLYGGGQPTDAEAAERILQELKTTFPDQTALSWSNVDVPTPDGGQTKWRMLTFNDTQDFWTPGSDTALTLKNATFVLMLREDQGRQIFLGGRWTEKAADSGARQQDMIAAAGTVGVALNVKID